MLFDVISDLINLVGAPREDCIRCSLRLLDAKTIYLIIIVGFWSTSFFLYLFTTPLHFLLSPPSVSSIFPLTSSSISLFSLFTPHSSLLSYLSYHTSSLYIVVEKSISFVRFKRLSFHHFYFLLLVWKFNVLIISYLLYLYLYLYSYLCVCYVLCMSRIMRGGKWI